MTNILWPINGYNRGPIAQVQPFVYDDAVSIFDILKLQKAYLVDELTPYVNNSVKDLYETIDESIENVIEIITENGVVANDPVVAGILDNNNSATRAALALATSTVTPELFGAVGDGVADDTAAVQAFFNYLAANGGAGVSARTYRITATISILEAVKSASYDGMGSTTFLFRMVNSGNAFSTRNLDKWTFKNFTIDGRNASVVFSHGMSNANCRDCVVDSVTVWGFGLSAVMFYKHESFSGISSRNTIANCVAQGGGTGRNGFFHETSSDSVIEYCSVYNLARTGPGPGYALQLKNNCVDCRVTGGTVNGAVAGFAFGYEQSDSWCERNVIEGVTAVNVDWGFLASRARDNHISLTVDMSGGGLYGVRVAGNAIRNIVDATILKVPAGATAVYIQDDSNIVNVPLIDQLLGSFLELAPSANLNRISVGRITNMNPQTVPTLSLPEMGDNTVQFDSETPWVNITLQNGWTTQLGRTPQMKRIGNTVYLRGQVTGGTDNLIANISQGFAPKEQLRIFSSALGGGYVSVSSGGQISGSTSTRTDGASLNLQWTID